MQRYVYGLETIGAYQSKHNTLDIYAHAIPGSQEEAAEIMDEITALVALPADLPTRSAAICCK